MNQRTFAYVAFGVSLAVGVGGGATPDLADLGISRSRSSTAALLPASPLSVSSNLFRSAVASLDLDPTYCWYYEEPPPDCLEGYEGGGGSVEESTAWPWPQQFDILCSYKGRTGLGGVGRVSGSSYTGVCFASGGCFFAFNMELSWWDAVRIWGGLPTTLTGTVIQENGCG